MVIKLQRRYIVTYPERQYPSVPTARALQTDLYRCRYWTQCKNLAHKEVCGTNSFEI